jgi:hypothetical protein
MPYDLTSLTNLKRIIDFSVYSEFYLSLAWCDEFQGSYLLDTL